jgi:inositol-phosphate phosphatase / L-galactose 1-phosphate phosphatase / histidinol-phosphatase
LPMRTNKNGARVESKHSLSLSETIVLATSPDIFSGATSNAFAQLKRACKGVYYGGDCYNFALIAQDHGALVVEAGLKTVDFIALVNPIVEAGGYVCDWRGDPLNMQSDGTIIAAANRRLADEVLKVIRA